MENKNYIIYLHHNISLIIKHSEMRSIKVNKNGKEVIVNLPTSIKEISSDFLTDVTKHIEVENNYALVAVVMGARLFDVLNPTKSKKDSNTTVTALFCKKGKTFNECLDYKVGDNLIITGTDLGRGIHISIKQPYNLAYIANTISSDSKVRTSIFNGDCYESTDDGLPATPMHYFVAFKLVPICDIHGIYHVNVLNEEASESESSIS